MKKVQPELSAVIPAYNEEGNIQKVYRHVSSVLKRAVDSFEIIFVNDGSHDATLKVMQKLAAKDPAVRIVSLSRNFGKEIATTAGIHHSRGKAIIMIDADDQFPAELIPQFIEKWRGGAQIVTGIRISNQKEGVVKRFGSHLFYQLMKRFTDAKITPGATDFRLIDSSIQKEFIRFNERHRMTRGLIDWVGFNEAFIEFHANERSAGTAAYTFSKLAKLGVHSFVSLSLAPLYFSGYAGLIITPLALLLGVFVIVEQIILGDPIGLNITGTAMLGILLLFFLGILLMSQGLMALYISHIHTETQNRPLYIVDHFNSAGIEEA